MFSREEDEEEDSNEACSAKGSEDAASANENNANDSQVASVGKYTFLQTQGRKDF